MSMQKIVWVAPCDTPSAEITQSFEDHLRSLDSHIAFDKAWPLDPSPSVNEKAALFAHALTRRDWSVLWCSKGGRGATGVLHALKMMLPPWFPHKIVLGYSDFSLLGIWLSLHYPVSYIHVGMNLKQSDGGDPSYQRTLDVIKHLKNREHNPQKSSLRWLHPPGGVDIEGLILPINLSLLPSLLVHVPNPPDFPLILMVEDCNEYEYRSIRILELLKSSKWAERLVAVIMGDFTSDSEDVPPLSPETFQRWVSKHLKIPCAFWPEFGHGSRNVPLVAFSNAFLRQDGTLVLHPFQHTVFNQKVDLPFPHKKLYFSGISGAGMASVARLAYERGAIVGGNDQVCAPPMGPWLRTFAHRIDEGFNQQFESFSPEAIVVGNRHGLKERDGRQNQELKAVFESEYPLLSFPKWLHLAIRESSPDVVCVVAGTHGKTTTTAALVHAALNSGESPSFLIGGQPRLYSKSAHLAQRNFWILEGDEYDCAFFDKGPKFFHYEPNLLVLTHLEYDHADIYRTFEDYRQEFFWLVERTLNRKGIVIFNRDVESLRELMIPFLEQYSSQMQSFGLSEVRITGEDYILYQGDRFQFLPDLVFPLPLQQEHNRLNALAALMAYRASQALRGRTLEWSQLQHALCNFQGVKQRFEKIGSYDGRDVYRDFAHHPTALSVSLKAFSSSVHVLFHCHTASFRRNVFQEELGQVLSRAASAVVVPPPTDYRVPESERFDEKEFSRQFPQIPLVSNPQIGLKYLWESSQVGDTILIVSSGDLDGLLRTIPLGVFST